MEIPIYVPPAAEWDNWVITGYVVRVKYPDECASLLTANIHPQIHRSIDEAFSQARELAEAFQTTGDDDDSPEVSIVALVNSEAL